MAFDNIIRVYNKRKELLAVCDGETAGKTPEALQNMLVAPRVRNVLNGESTLTFQVLADTELWQSIKDPENLYHVNGRWYTALTASAFVETAEKSVRMINASLPETWALLSKSYNQAYNCGIYCYAKAAFVRNTTDGAVFRIKAADCSNPGNTISSAAAWAQVKAWSATDGDGNKLSYAILTSKEYAPTKWEDAPAAVHLKSLTVSGDTAEITITPRAATAVTQTYDYQTGYYQLDSSLRVYPAALKSVKVNYTTTSGGTYQTVEQSVSYSYSSSTGRFTINFTPPAGAVVNAVIAEYDYYDLGKISAGATCTFAYGAEVVDEHTFVILPKADSKYALTIDGLAYSDSQVKDARGVVMPRGSGGYAMWAALANSGWTLGICDVLATGFDASIDYGCFNVESDMKDVLYNVQYIQQLYGGLLIWDSENKVLHYRAENDEDYQAYDDGFNRWTGYEFRLGKNITQLPTIAHDNDLITRAYLLGYGGLNVKAVNGGKTYIENYNYTDAVYEGYLEQPLIYDTNDEGGQRQLMYWGHRELAKMCRPRKTISLTVQDIRTVKGYEHETFDIADIVRVRYYDDEYGVELVEQQRITVWEYNVFAMWDSLVELGNKTQNLVDLFKLIYNTQLDAPGANASGEVSSNNIRIPGASGGYGELLTDRLDLIAQTTTHNSDAIAGLIVDTNSMYAQVQLFAQYQKQTNALFTQTYAGLQFYADQQSASAELSAKKYTDTTADAINQTISQTDASLKLYADDKAASAELSAKKYTDTTTSDLNKDLTKKITQTEASLQTYADDASASALLAAKAYTNSAVADTASVAYVQAYVTEQMAQIDIVASLNKEVGEKATSMKSFITVSATAGVTLGSSLASINLNQDGNITISCMNGISFGAGCVFRTAATFNGNVTFKGTVTGVYAQFA